MSIRFGFSGTSSLLNLLICLISLIRKSQLKSIFEIEMMTFQLKMYYIKLSAEIKGNKMLNFQLKIFTFSEFMILILDNNLILDNQSNKYSHQHFVNLHVQFSNCKFNIMDSNVHF